MSSYLDCYPCLVRHALDAARQITAEPARQREVMNRVLRLLPEMAPDSTPVRLAAEVHRLIRETLGVEDPNRALKEKYNKVALSLLPKLRGEIERAEDRLDCAVRIAIAGHIIDFGALGENFDLEATLRTSLTAPLGVDDLPRLRRDLERAKRLVYVGDNAGEIAFDRLLVEELKRSFEGEIAFVVRGRPILNDATKEDADIVGLTGLVPLVPSDGDGPGCELEYAGQKVKALFDAADLVISKGQGNYEALSEEPYPIYFLLWVKCRVIARDMGCEEGAGVVKYSDRGP